MRVIECEQGSQEWKDARAGKITASRICDVVNYLKKGGESQARINYRNELVAERLTGKTDEYTFKTGWLKDGKDREPAARAEYEIRTENFVTQVGFVLHPTWDFSGASPDGLLVPKGLELKCGKATTHIAWLKSGIVPPEHIDQMLWTMRCCELDGMDFASYQPDMLDERLQLFVVPLPRNEKRIAELEIEVEKFEETVQQAVKKVEAYL